MAAIIQHTDPRAHPRFMREQRRITAILTRSLVSQGWAEHQARQKAEAILSPIPPKWEPSRSRFVPSRNAGA